MKQKPLLFTAAIVLFFQAAIFAQPKTGGLAAEYNKLSEQVSACLEKDDYRAAIPLLKRMHELLPAELPPVENLGILYTNLPEEKPSQSYSCHFLTGN